MHSDWDPYLLAPDIAAYWTTKSFLCVRSREVQFPGISPVAIDSREPNRYISWMIGDEVVDVFKVQGNVGMKHFDNSLRCCRYCFMSTSCLRGARLSHAVGVWCGRLGNEIGNLGHGCVVCSLVGGGVRLAMCDLEDIFVEKSRNIIENVCLHAQICTNTLCAQTYCL